MSTFDQLSREVLQPKLLLDDLDGQWYWTLGTSMDSGSSTINSRRRASERPGTRPVLVSVKSSVHALS